MCGTNATSLVSSESFQVMPFPYRVA